MRLYFQDGATAIMEGIVELHNDIFFYLIIIVCLVIWVILYILNTFRFENVGVNSLLLDSHRVTHGTAIEIVWTVTPSIILVLIAIPSFSLLYAMDEVVEPSVTLKVLGHQWYWSYEYTDYEGMEIAFDSYMLDESDLEVGELRLLEVDRKVWVPVATHIRVLVTAVDVLHSWAVPALGVKMDAVPGRLNQTSLFIKRLGTFYGQCSEICGVNHGFMPIAVKVVPVESFQYWLGCANEA